MQPPLSATPTWTTKLSNTLFFFFLSLSLAFSLLSNPDCVSLRAPKLFPIVGTRLRPSELQIKKGRSLRFSTKVDSGVAKANCANLASSVTERCTAVLILNIFVRVAEAANQAFGGGAGVLT